MPALSGHQRPSEKIGGGYISGQPVIRSFTHFLRLSSLLHLLLLLVTGIVLSSQIDINSFESVLLFDCCNIELVNHLQRSMEQLAGNKTIFLFYVS